MNPVFTRRTLMLGAGISALLPLSACGSNSGAKDAAQGLASALTNLDVNGQRFVDTLASDAQASLQNIVRNMAGASVEVTAGDVAKGDNKDARTVPLHWAWTVDSSQQKWEYDTTATLNKIEDAWQTVWEPTLVHSDLTHTSGLQLVTDAPTRGEILGAHDSKIVALRPVVRVGLDKTQLSDEEQQSKSARALAELVDVDADAYENTVKNAGDQQFVEAIVLREEAFKELDRAKLDAIDGVHTAEDSLPLAPSAGFAPDILGSVGDASEEDVKNSDGTISAGQQVGRGGLQGRFQDQLGGTYGYAVNIVNLETDGSPGYKLSTPQEVKAVDGKPMTITLDADLQQKAVDLLAGQTSPSAIVALRVSTGEIITAANGEASEGFSTALLAQYAPGSTFKVPTSLALLRKNFTPESTVNCSESVTVDGQTFKNASTYPADALGEQPLSVAVAQSCNTAFINERDTVSQEDLQNAAKSLGVEMSVDLGIDAFMGTVPATDSEVTHAASLIGQGDVLVSPLAMAVVAASAAKGEIVKPVLVKDAGLEEAKPAGDSVTADEAKQLQKLMRGVVEDGGLKPLQELSPNVAYGKTGTAEYGNDNPPKTHSWVIAVHQDIAMALVVEDGDFGSITGAPIALEYLKAASA